MCFWLNDQSVIGYVYIGCVCLCAVVCLICVTSSLFCVCCDSCLVICVCGLIYRVSLVCWLIA